MKNSEYWKKRFEQLENSQNNAAATSYAELERHYRAAQKEIEGKINAWYQRFANNNGITMQEARMMLNGNALKEFQWDVHEYIKYGQENALSGAWMKELENASAKFHVSRLEALKMQTEQSLQVLFAKQQGIVSSTIGGAFQSGYYHTAYELQKGFGIGWDIAGLDQDAIEKLIYKPWAADGYNFSERIWTNKEKLISEMHTTLTRNILTGGDPQKAIDEIAKKMNTSKVNAGRLVMTEEAYFSSLAQKKCFNDLDVEQYQIVATLDSHTSDICRGLDGQVFPMKDFEPGVTAPPFHVNCRSTTVPYFDEDFGQIGERAARDEDGKTYYVPVDMTYPEWKKSFVDGQTSDLKPVDTGATMKGEPKDDLESTIKGLLDGSSTDREKLGQQVLSELGVDGVDVHVKGMLERGSCSILVDNGTLKVTDYNLDANDDRSIGYQIKTAFHEGFHASGNGLPTDCGKMNASRWLDIEETFAECSSYYMVGQYGITDLAPAYPDKLVKMLPRLKQLPEFSSCTTISDFGKVAHDIRPTTGSAWKAMSQAAMRKKFSFSDYTQQYFPEIRKDVGGYVDKILENMPKSKPYRASMIADLEKSMEHVEMHGTTLSDNESLMLNNAIAVCMGKVGVK